MTEPDRSGTAEDGSSSAEETPSRSEETQQEEEQANERESREDEINEGPGKMFECDVCNMKFSNGANMRRHKMRHTGVKPYECRVCQKRFFRKDHLMEHFTTHTKSLPYHCPICNKGFQRQIAMRAHFQNEHVGHNDVVKTCPLCTFRATSMKSLRVHFYNRHGIDLDNPATPPAGPSSSGSNLRFDTECGERSSESTSPLQMMPPHFLAPHVEISMAPSGSDFNTHGSFSPPADLSQRPASTNGNTVSPSASPQSSNSNTPSSSSAQQTLEPRLPPPSISLIPIKQEPRDREENSGSQNPAQAPPSTDGPSAPQESALSLIKVSPLKSLLREEPSPRRGRTPSTLAQCLEQPPRLAGCCQCIHCGIVFPDQTLYFLHKGCHSDSNPWKCNICGEQCSNIYDFNSHLLSKTHQ